MAVCVCASLWGNCFATHSGTSWVTHPGDEQRLGRLAERWQKKVTPPEKKARGKITFQSTTSGGGG